MITADRRLNHAHPLVDLAAGRDVEDDVAGVIGNARLKSRPTHVRRLGRTHVTRSLFVGRHFSCAVWTVQMPIDGFADERAQFLFVHVDDSTTSTLSTIPTMAASTGAAFFPMASLAERPSSTMSTFSPTPAPAPSTASSSPPRGVSSRLSGCTSSSLPPSSLRCFWVETTVPVTRAKSMTSAQIPVIDDAHDARVGGDPGGAKRESRSLS